MNDKKNKLSHEDLRQAHQIGGIKSQLKFLNQERKRDAAHLNLALFFIAIIGLALLITIYNINL